METITGRSNPAVVEAAKLADKKHRTERGAFAFEGIKLFSEAAAAGADFRRVFVTEDAYRKYQSALTAALRPDQLSLVSDAVYAKLSLEQAPQGVFSVASLYHAPKKENATFVLLLDGVADPGNLGAILRSADAFGVDTVYLGAGGADLYNPKTVRACMGSLFRVDVRESGDLPRQIASLRAEGFRLYATMLDRDAKDLRTLDFSGKIGFVVGNEGHGISDAVRAACTGSTIIPMREGPESLNASVAASVVLWEAARAGNRI